MTKKQFLIDYQTGITENFEGSLEGAQRTAEEGMSYTQQDVLIIEDNDRRYKSNWQGVEAGEDDEVLASFGSNGFYTPWRRLTKWEE